MSDEKNLKKEETVANEIVKEETTVETTLTETGGPQMEEAVEIIEDRTDHTKTAFDDFDWDNTGKHNLPYTKSEIDAYASQYDSTLTSVLENEIVSGLVSAIGPGDIVLDINYKSDGLIPLSEFRDLPDLKVGDKVDVYVEHQEDERGQLVLSRRKAKLLKAWESIVGSYENGTAK